jgi:hypothetical protein
LSSFPLPGFELWVPCPAVDVGPHAAATADAYFFFVLINLAHLNLLKATSQEQADKWLYY